MKRPDVKEWVIQEGEDTEDMPVGTFLPNAYREAQDKYIDYLLANNISAPPSCIEGYRKWINTDQRTPIAYKTGNWDGKNSDQVVAEDKQGKRYLAHFCEGILDGAKYEDWYDSNDFLIDQEIVRFLEIPI